MPRSSPSSAVQAAPAWSSSNVAPPSGAATRRAAASHHVCAAAAPDAVAASGEEEEHARDAEQQRQQQQQQHAAEGQQQDTAAQHTSEALEAVDHQQQQQGASVEFLGVLEGMQTVRGTLHTAADPTAVYRLLTDYDSCPRVFRNISSTSTSLDATSGRKTLVQGCRWQFLAFSGTFDVHLGVHEDPAERLLVFKLQQSAFMKDFEGRWQVQPLPGGGCRVEHVLAVKPVVAIPAAVAPFTSSIFKKQVAELLQDLADEIGRLRGLEQQQQQPEGGGSSGEEEA